ncbi:ArfGap-domain-containing protein [Cristinia sonorae]|uniref:ArfGap-domain-containing protein n=1 Tax=Cristinia sonorae TaxID=1940300 RepID=A0A8K0XN74_9AGAR|nr:ArfGap-domain-containing protein [Cristinia sonorae]
MDQTQARKILQELIKREDLDNKKCVDCSNPNPQWASLSFAIFLCLQCAGVHRGFGVHVSFVRSVSMDTWQEEQIKRMQLGGNAPFNEFMKSYPAEGGYTPGMNTYDKYHCWAASQYREKLDAQLAGKEWTQSTPPAGAGALSPPGRPTSAQGLRKSRASARSSTGPPRSNSPASFGNAPQTSSPLSTPSGISAEQKSANESFFATLGQANSMRPDDLPPSQGGKYQGFGSTPAPSMGSQHPSWGMSSAAAPTLSELQENPVAALSKGWSLFSTAVAGATRAVSQNVIQPAAEKVMDPTFQQGVRGYVSEAGKKAGQLGQNANTWGKHAFGVDVAESVGGVVGTVSDKLSGGPGRRGYGQVAQGYGGESSSLYHDHDDEDFFGEFNSGSGGQQRQYDPASSRQSNPNTSSSSGAGAKKADDWDEWKDF